MNTSHKVSLISGGILAVFGLALVPAHAQQLVQISTGYQDYPNSTVSPNGGNNLWYGSPNTVFIGDAGQAQSGDPDEDAVLLQNLGGSDATLSTLTIGSGAYDLFSLDGISGPVTLAPNVNYIFAGVDGSDIGFGPGVDLTLDGTLYNYLDTTTGTTPTGGDYVLHGYPGGDESVEWTPIYTPNIGSSVPDSASTFGLLTMVMSALMAFRRRFARASAG